MAILQSTLQQALNGHGNVVGVVGEPGVGESRLCYEFLELNRQRGVTICKANCGSHIQTVPLLPVLQLLVELLGGVKLKKIVNIQITLDNLYPHPLASFEFFGETMRSIIVTINQAETDFTCWWWWANSHGLASGRS
jgi:hypothetical protein